jgi:hyperosmotically inducible periplasmic protein
MNRKIPVIALFAFLAMPAFASAQEAIPTPKTQDNTMDDAAEATGDAWITTKVKADLLATKDVSGTDVKVETKDGVVTLTGSVATQAEADKAKEVASGIKGVTSVDSQLTVGAAKTPQ